MAPVRKFSHLANSIICPLPETFSRGVGNVLGPFAYSKPDDVAGSNEPICTGKWRFITKNNST